MQEDTRTLQAYRPNLSGQTALVTGAGRGLGEACAAAPLLTCPRRWAGSERQIERSIARPNTPLKA